MNKTRWVQHISGQGEKYEVERCYEYWEVSDNRQDSWYLRLPLKEYILCDPPEEWEDVTSQVYTHESVLGLMKTLNHRLRRVRCAKATGFDNPDWAFIVERKRS